MTIIAAAPAVRVDTLTSKAQSFAFDADENARASIAERLNLVGLSQFSARLEVSLKAQIVRISGQVQAQLEQRCVVSLVPVPGTVDDHFVLELVSEDEALRRDEDESYADPEAPEYDVLEDESIDLGEIAIQTLAISLDPYPRAADCRLEDTAPPSVDINADPLKPASPFAVLKGLKDKS